jgi:hypothetical protein
VKLRWKTPNAGNGAEAGILTRSALPLEELEEQAR